MCVVLCVWWGEGKKDEEKKKGEEIRVRREREISSEREREQCGGGLTLHYIMLPCLWDWCKITVGVGSSFNLRHNELPSHQSTKKSLP